MHEGRRLTVKKAHLMQRYHLVVPATPLLVTFLPTNPATFRIMSYPQANVMRASQHCSLRISGGSHALQPSCSFGHLASLLACFGCCFRLSLLQADFILPRLPHVFCSKTCRILSAHQPTLVRHGFACNSMLHLSACVAILNRLTSSSANLGRDAK